MKTVFVCCVVAAFVASSSAQGMFGSLKPASVTEFQNIYNAVSSIHKFLSGTPLARFLPPLPQMVADAFNISKQTSNLQVQMKKTLDYINKEFQKAAAKANLPPGLMDRYAKQMNQIFQASSSQASGAANNFLQSSAP